MTKERNGVVYTELRRFGDLTSAKGVGRAIKAEYSFLKGMWVMAVVLLLAITVYNVTNLTLEFLEYNTGTKIMEKKIDIERAKSSDILLCNLNPYSSLLLDEAIQKRSEYGKLITDWTTPTATSSGEQASNRTIKVSGEELRSLNSVRQELLTGHSGLYQHLGPEGASNLSHEWRNFIISCQVYFLDGVMERSVPCSYGNLRVERYWHKDYFNCFKFFGGEQRGTRPATGMSYLVYIDSLQNGGNNSDLVMPNKGKGALLTKVEGGTFLDTNKFGVEILPGYVTTIKFNPVHRKRLLQPYGNCTPRGKQNHGSNKDESASDNSAYTLPYVYTEEACLSACIEYNVIQTCKCQDVGQHGVLLDVFKNVTMCGSTDQGRDSLLQRMTCAQKIRSKLRTKCLSNCSSPCTEIIDDQKVTYLEISQEQIREKLKEEKIRSSVPKLNRDGHNESPDFEKLKLNPANFAWVYLKRESTSYFYVEDTESMTISDWLAKVGGAMNLWSGITVFVFVEIVDFLCRLTRGIFNSEMPTGKKGIPENSTRCQGRCGCTCVREFRNEAQHHDGDRYTGTYGNINSAFY